MNIGQVKDKAIKLIAQYSNGGVVVPTADNYDYLSRGNDFIDIAQKMVAERAKIHAVVSYSQYPIEPINGKYVGFEMVQFLPGISDDITSTSGTGGRAFYFETSGNCEIYVEESADGGTTWTSVPSIQYINGTTVGSDNPIIPTEYDVFVAYKGTITPTSTSYLVRLRFTSSYSFVVRNRALYNIAFYDYTYVPVYTPKLEVEVISDRWYEFDKIVHRTDDRMYQQMIDFSSIGRKTLIIDYFYTGSFDIHYYKIPEDITNATADATNLEVYPGIPQEAIAFYVAGQMIKDEYPALARILLQEWQAMYDNLKTSEINGAQYISNVTGW